MTKFRNISLRAAALVTILLVTVICASSAEAGERWRRDSNPYYQTFGIKGTGMFTWGLEWGSTLSFYDKSSFIFMAEEGFAVEGGELLVDPHMNAFALFSVGYNVSYNTNVSINTGWQGVAKEKRIFPVTGRVTYVFTGLPRLTSERTPTYTPDIQNFVFFDTGVGISQAQLHGLTLLAKAGYGVRLPLGYGMSLDTSLSFQASYAHPELYDKFADRKVPWSKVGKSDSFYMGLSLSMAVRF